MLRAADLFSGISGASSDAQSDNSLQNIDASADSLQRVGSNVIASGRVLIRYKNYTINADKAIANLSSKDIEAVGNVELIERSELTESVSLTRYRELIKNAQIRVKIEDIETNPTGEKLLKVKIYEDRRYYKGHKIVGNLSTGALEFQDFQGRLDLYYVKGKYATRNTSGVIEVTDAEISTCEYMEQDQAHYSIGAGRVKIFPYEEEAKKSLGEYNTDLGDHSIWAYNCIAKVAGVPVMWAPMFYKPKDENWGWFNVSGGHSSDFGYFIKLSKKFRISDYPDATSTMMLDYYTGRGVAVGTDTEINTQNSHTEIFFYGIRDSNPYGASAEDKDIAEAKDTGSRFDIPNYRYDLRLNHINHITPRLDFRGQFEKISDYNYLLDFFEDRYYKDPQPPTFAALEYQFDRFTTSLYVRPKVNYYNTETERLPEFRIDVPRQELFENIYYQGETSFANLKMRWRDYDEPRTTGNEVDPADYAAFRFDTLHMFYYPFKLFDNINLIPRMGGRVTSYSKSSRTKVGQNELEKWFMVDELDATPDYDITNYEQTNRWQTRLIGEMGVEANTKFSRSWNDVKNAFWKLDGVRHVFVPYTNYTFIPNPTFDKDKLFYFDDIDRIDDTNFVRLGGKNRLESRTGNYGEESIYEWMSLENYIDYHFAKHDGFKNLGDLGTIFTFTPANGLSLTSRLLLDTGRNSDHDAETYRAGEADGRPGIGGSWINRWQNTISYKILEDLKVSAGYDYVDAYRNYSAYSMGSTFTELDSTSAFLNNYTGRSQTVNFGLEYPIPIDDKTRGKFEIRYDFEMGYVREASMKIIRTFHCWEGAIELQSEQQRDSSLDRITKNSIILAFYLKALPSLGVKQKQNADSSD